MVSIIVYETVYVCTYRFNCAHRISLRARVMLLESSAEEINHHNVVRLVAVRFGETYIHFLKTSERF